jgi:hypothetical protein
MSQYLEALGGGLFDGLETDGSSAVPGAAAGHVHFTLASWKIIGDQLVADHIEDPDTSTPVVATA